jgi:hypothetical protein
MELQKIISDLRRQLKLINKAIFIFERLAVRQNTPAKSVGSERNPGRIQSTGTEARRAG